MIAHFLSLFPEMIHSALNTSLIGRAQKKKIISCQAVNIRNFCLDKRKSADAKAFGGDVGMILRPDVLHRAWLSCHVPDLKPWTIYLTPQGKTFSYHRAKKMSHHRHIVFVCGHYEGIDERFVTECVDEEISIGDYVLTGGELAALVVFDACIRFLPGVVGNPSSVSEDSFENDCLKYPQYTYPVNWNGHQVPEVLRSGNHQKIKKWRNEQSMQRTKQRRPDLIR